MSRKDARRSSSPLRVRIEGVGAPRGSFEAVFHDFLFWRFSDFEIMWKKDAQGSISSLRVRDKGDCAAGVCLWSVFNDFVCSGICGLSMGLGLIDGTWVYERNLG